MAGERKVYELEDCLERLIDYRGISPPKSVNGIPVISAKVVKNGRIIHPVEQRISEEDYVWWMRRGIPQPGDVILTTEGPMGETAILDDQKYAPGQRVVFLRGDSAKVSSTYLFYYLQSQLGQSELRRLATGTTVEGVSQASIRRIKVEAPRPEEQNSITNLLGSLDAKIELNRRMAATLEEMTRALFKSWFVDFDPVRAKAESRDVDLPADTAALFPNAFGENGLPMGWVRVSLLDHARLISGGTPKTEEPSYWGGPIPWASAKDVSQCADRFLIATERTITPRGLEESATRMVPARSTVVVARGATTGRHCLFGRDMAMNHTCYALHSEANRPFWLACTFSALVDELVHGAHGSVFDTITTTTLQTAKIVHAGREIISAFERTIQPIYERILSLVEEAATLRTLRDTLLPKLISGELRIKDANGAVEAA